MQLKSVTPVEKTWVEETIKDQTRVYREAKDNMLLLRKQRALRLTGKTPRAFQSLLGKGVRVPMSWALVQTVTGMIAKNDPKFRRIPRGERDKEASQRIQNLAWPLIQTYSKLAREDLFYQLVDQLAGDGRAVVKLRRSVMEGYPVREQGQSDKEYNRKVEDYLENARSDSALRITRIDPMTFMPSRETYDTSSVVESGKRPIKQVMRRLGLKFGVNNSLEPVTIGDTLPDLLVPSGMSPNEFYDEVWTPDEVYIRIGNQDVMKAENEFGFIPYRWRYGQTTSIPDPMLEGTSVVFPFAGIEPWLNTLMSVVVAWSVLGGTPILQNISASNQETPGTDLAMADLPLGKMVKPAAGRRLEFVVPPPVGREVIEAIQLLLSIYEKAGITSMARGFIGTRTAGTAYDSALEQAGAMFTPLVRGVEGILEDIVELTLRGTEKIGIPMWITGYALEPQKGSSRKELAAFRLTPKDIGGYYDIHCELKLSNLQDTISRGMHAAMMKAHGLWSEDTAVEFSGRDDPEAERLAKLKDKIRNSPLFQEQVLRPAMTQDPQMAQVVEEAEAQGVTLIDLLMQGTAAARGTTQGSTGASSEEDTYGGAPQPRGGRAPRGGGRVAGAAKRPGGTRKTTPGERFPKGG